MSRTPRFRPTGAVVATGAVLGALALAGCGAGQITQTDTQVPAVVGANAGVGAIVVRDAYIEFGEQAQGANIYPRGRRRAAEDEHRQHRDPARPAGVGQQPGGGVGRDHR